MSKLLVSFLSPHKNVIYAVIDSKDFEALLTDYPDAQIGVVCELPDVSGVYRAVSRAVSGEYGGSYIRRVYALEKERQLANAQ